MDKLTSTLGLTIPPSVLTRADEVIQQQKEPTHGPESPPHRRHRSGTGTKLYAVRDAQGRFKDIQTYKRAHGQDIKRRAKGEK